MASKAQVQLDPRSNNMVDFITGIMSYDSTTKLEGPLAKALDVYLKAKGWHVHLQGIPNEKDRCNLLATRIPFKAPGPRLIFNTHLDTVPPYIPPTVTKNGEIRGRGSNETKGQLGAIVFAAHRIIKEHPKLEKDLGLLFVVGEETDHIGMTEANNLNLLPEFLVVGEPTELKFARMQKGVLKLNISTAGRAVHSGYPEMGSNAIDKLIDVLVDLRQYNWPASDALGATTVNVGKITGGQVLNALAESANAGLMIRVTTTCEDILRRCKAVIAGRAEIEVLGSNEPVHLTDPPAPYESHIVAFNTDLAYFKRKNELKGAYLFGAGSITNAFSKDEFVGIAELERAVQVYVDLAVHLLGSP